MGSVIIIFVDNVVEMCYNMIEPVKRLQGLVAGDFFCLELFMVVSGLLISNLRVNYESIWICSGSCYIKDVFVF